MRLRVGRRIGGGEGEVVLTWSGGGSMPFPMKVQPIETKVPAGAAKPAGKWRLKRLFERQFQSVLRTSSAEKLGGGGGDGREREEADASAAAIEPASVCLDKMVLSFMEGGGGGERPSRCGRSRCNCFHGNCSDSSDDEPDLHSLDPYAPLPGDASEILKGLVPCASLIERNLLADASKIVEKIKIGEGKGDCRWILTDELRALGYDASICKSHWDKTSTVPAGEYEYVDVIVEGQRLLVDVDFRSEFEIARSTKAYRSVLQSLPSIFVGRADRLQQIVAVVCEAARQSLKQKDLSFPPWRKPEYVRAKWLAPYLRSFPAPLPKSNASDEIPAAHHCHPVDQTEKNEAGAASTECPHNLEAPPDTAVETEEKPAAEVVAWQPPAVKPKAAAQPGAKVVTGLASVLSDEPLP